MVMELRNSTFLIQDNNTLREMEEDFGGILIKVKKHIPSDGGLTIEQQASNGLETKISRTFLDFLHLGHEFIVISGHGT